MCCNEKSSSLIWAILDFFVNLLTALAVISLIANTPSITKWSMSGRQIYFVVTALLFLTWAIRPLILSLKEYLKNKKEITIKIRSK